MKINILNNIFGRVSFREMPIGSTGLIVSSDYEGTIVTKVAGDLVAGYEPGRGSVHWTDISANTLEVQLLPEGTQITLEL